MPLSVGKVINSYEVLSLIGAGGMGEVYRARDITLKREVALKVLPASFSNSPERIARFQREAEVLASLDHPHIGHIYGIVESNGSRALVLALIEGPTLEDRIAAGPIAWEEAVAIAKQVAEALEYAHERGVIHRDLKPANIKINSDGLVKVLDFGLAKVLENGPPTGMIEDSPTLTVGHTRPGVILGTVAYMSPEQAVGRPVDRRSDIFSFGAVLYEMLTGERAFAGTTTADVLEAIVKTDPDWNKLPAETPPSLRSLLRRCLVKDRKQRLQAIGEARILLYGQMEAAMSTLASAPPVSRPGTMTAIVAALLAVGFAVAGAGWYRATRPVEQPLKPIVRLDVDLGSDVSLDPERGTTAVLSPDGQRLVYLSRQRLFTRRLDQPKADELAGTEGALGSPFFSPDGQWVVFFAQSKLKKISVEGGAAITLCEAMNFFGGSWGEDGNIIAALNFGFLRRIPSTGGELTAVMEQPQGESNRFPQVLLGGKAVLFTSNATGNAWDGASIEVVSLADGRRKTLQRGGTYARYVPSSDGRDGHLVYVNRGTLFGVPFDLKALAVRGTPSPVLSQVSYSATYGYAQFDFSQKGTLVYRSGTAEGSLLTIQWLDSEGKMKPLLVKPDAYQSAWLSPDGQRLAISTTDLWVYEWQRDRMTRLTFGGSLGGNSVPAVWSPDGRYLIFRKPGQGLFWTRSDGAGEPQRLVQGSPAIMAYSFTPDGKRLAFREFGTGTGLDLWTMPVESDGAGLRGGKPVMFLGTPFNEDNPAFSPDGRWLAYSSNEGGTAQIFVRGVPDRGGKWQISDIGGRYPEWSRNGRELFYRTADNQIAVAAYTVRGDSFVADKPRIWSEKRLANAFNNGSNFSLAPDGKRFVIFMPAEVPGAQQAQNHIIFLENFFDELRRKVPVGK